MFGWIGFALGLGFGFKPFGDALVDATSRKASTEVLREMLGFI